MEIDFFQGKALQILKPQYKHGVKHIHSAGPLRTLGIDLEDGEEIKGGEPVLKKVNTATDDKTLITPET